MMVKYMENKDNNILINLIMMNYKENKYNIMIQEELGVE